jgi:hypothetical protein
VNAIANPHPSQLDSVLVQGNRIWNVNLTNTPGSNDWAIWVGHGGVDVLQNVIWGLRDNATSTRAVRVRATQDFGPHPIRIEDNIFWTTRGWMAEGSPSGAANVTASSNRGTDGSTVETVVDASAFVGPVPALGASGSADSGGGPGTGFALASSSTTTSAAPTTTTAPSTTTTTVLLSTTSTTAPAPSPTTPTTTPSTTPAPSTPPSSITLAPTTTVAEPSRPETTGGSAPTSTTEPADQDDGDGDGPSLDQGDGSDDDLAFLWDWPGEPSTSTGSDPSSTEPGLDATEDGGPSVSGAGSGGVEGDGDEAEVLAFEAETQDSPSGSAPIAILAGLAAIGAVWLGMKWRVSGIG